jgi:hypothetical protein
MCQVVVLLCAVQCCIRVARKQLQCCLNVFGKCSMGCTCCCDIPLVFGNGYMICVVLVSVVLAPLLFVCA